MFALLIRALRVEMLVSVFGFVEYKPPKVMSYILASMRGKSESNLLLQETDWQWRGCSF